MRNIFKNGRESGFTLIELIMVIVLLALAGVTLTIVLKGGADSFSFVISRKEAVQDARQAVFQVSRDVRQIKDINNILAASDSSFQFKIPVYQNPDLTVTYSFAGDNVTRNGSLLADGVTSFQFRYFDLNGNQLSNPIPLQQIWEVEAVMAVRKGNETATLQSRIFPRNFKYGVVLP